ncbi:uncharacterized protein LOC129407495 [Boleophthalmus pectinirostris]|uniref:uncharacterized protein LOC129407495 n=1 Tax=Boleophthalmus pectinirostris TaxID=150288 RepID=UPI002432DB91|nr:uncharacterized protein LOC129407495 [Boleophthalmus pectinirostris]
MNKRHRNIHKCLTKEPSQQSYEGQSLDWDPAESDTESLVQERAYQQQLKLNISNSSPVKTVCFNNNVSTSHKTNEGSGGDDDDEGLEVFDSLEMSNCQPVLPQGQNVEYERNESITNSQVFPDDVYSHLHYGTNPKMSSKAVGWPREGPLISVDESFLSTEEHLCRNSKEGLKKDGYMLVTDTSQQLMIPQNLHCDQPYLLHPQYGCNNAISTPTPAQCTNVQLRPSEENHKHETENNSATSALTEEHVTHNQNHTQVKPGQMDKTAKAQKEKDIVKQNKLTLGRNTTKYGSYVKAHALRGPHGLRAQQAPKATSSSDIQSKIELPKTQQVKVRPMRKEKKAERKEDLTPSGPLQPLAPGVRAEQGHRLSSTITKAAVKRLKAPSSSQPLSPTIHLNINLDTTPHLPLLSTQQIPQSIIKLSYPHVSPELQISLSPGITQTRHKNPSMAYQGISGLHTNLNQWNLENIPEQWQRLTAVKEQLIFEEEDQRESVSEDQTVPLLSDSPSSTAQSSGSSYKVLPPIGQPGPEQDDELRSTQSGQRRVSDGYLVQTEKKKQLQTQTAYKAYSLKDYKQLKPDVTLRGLGPDYSAMEKTVRVITNSNL